MNTNSTPSFPGSSGKKSPTSGVENKPRLQGEEHTRAAASLATLGDVLNH